MDDLFKQLRGRLSRWRRDKAPAGEDLATIFYENREDVLQRFRLMGRAHKGGVSPLAPRLPIRRRINEVEGMRRALISIDAYQLKVAPDDLVIQITPSIRNTKQLKSDDDFGPKAISVTFGKVMQYPPVWQVARMGYQTGKGMEWFNTHELGAEDSNKVLNAVATVIGEANELPKHANPSARRESLNRMESVLRAAFHTLDRRLEARHEAEAARSAANETTAPRVRAKPAVASQAPAHGAPSNLIQFDPTRRR
ncbi:MAG: hypothetical protein AAF556_00375 [Pseudomonadota bacterium]